MKNYHYIYKIVCLLNEKEYIGVHSSNKEFDENYWSSSYILLKEIKKFGKHNFTRTVLSYHSSRDEAMKAEALLVNKEYTSNKNTYNVVCGGHGPNWTGTIIVKDKDGNNFCVSSSDERFLSGELVGVMKGNSLSLETKLKISKSTKEMIWLNKNGQNIRCNKQEVQNYLNQDWVKGRTFHHRQSPSKEVRMKIQASNLGKKCSEETKNIHRQNGKNKIWTTNGTESRFIDKEDMNFYLEKGWTIGKRHFQHRKKNRNKLREE